MNAKLSAAIIGVMVGLMPLPALASPLNYLATKREVRANNGLGDAVLATTAAVGLWSASVTAPSGNAFGGQNSTIADSFIEAKRISGCATAQDANMSVSASSTMYARIRLDEQCVISLSGTVSKFLDTPSSSFTFSVQGGALSYFYEAPAEGDTGDFAFSRSNLVLNAGTYEFEVRSTVEGGYGGVVFSFRLDAAIVPAPGAGGLAAAIALLASRRPRRSNVAVPTNE